MGSISTMANKCFFKILNIYLFLAVLGLHSSHGLSLIAESRAYSLALVPGFSLWWLLLLQSMGSRACGLQQLWLLGCGRQDRQLWLWAQLLHSRWDLPRPGIEPMSPALAGRFLTAGPPGKSWSLLLIFGSFYKLLCHIVQKKKKNYSIHLFSKYLLTIHW